MYKQSLVLFHMLAILALLPANEPQPIQFEQLACRGLLGYYFQSSSELNDPGSHQLGVYGMRTLFDGDRYTGWSEGVDGGGVGEVLWLQIPEGSDTLAVINGFARSLNLFQKNNRVREIEAGLYYALLPEMMISELGPTYLNVPTGMSTTLRLEDSPELELYSLDFDWDRAAAGYKAVTAAYPDFAAREGLPPQLQSRTYLLRLEIRGIYPGTAWNDTCLTELRAFNAGTLTAAEVYSREGQLWYSLESGSGVLRRVLYRERGAAYEPVELGPQGRWVTAIRTPLETGGRVATDFRLFKLPYPEPVELEAFSKAVRAGGIPIGFDRRRGVTLLLMDDGSEIELDDTTLLP